MMISFVQLSHVIKKEWRKFLTAYFKKVIFIRANMKAGIAFRMKPIILSLSLLISSAMIME
ncbi:hypothetical protein D3C77_640620 [compost metagenome]